MALAVPRPRSSSIRQTVPSSEHLRVGRLAAGEEDDAVHAQLAAGRRRPARSRRRQNAEPAAARMRPQFGSRPNAAVLTSGEVAIRLRDRVRLAGARRAGDLDLEQDGRALAVHRRSAATRSAQTSLERGGELAVGLPPSARSRSRRSRAGCTASFVEHSPSTEIRLKLSLTARLRKPCASPAASG